MSIYPIIRVKINLRVLIWRQIRASRKNISKEYLEIKNNALPLQRFSEEKCLQCKH